MVKEPLDENESGSEKAGLKLNTQKVKIMAARPMTSWQIEKWGNSDRFGGGEGRNHCGQ